MKQKTKSGICQECRQPIYDRTPEDKLCIPCEYHPDLTEIERRKLRLEMEADENFKRIFRGKKRKWDITRELIAEAKVRYNPSINEENHCVWETYGLTGTGKSNAMISLVRLIHPTLKVENIFFHDEQILQALEHLGRPDWIIRDENIGGANYGAGSNRVRSQLGAVTQTLRKRCIGFTFIGTQPAELDTTQYLFRSIDKDRKMRMTRFAVKDPQSGNYLGFVYIKVMDELDPFWVEYNARKEKFMQSIIMQDYTAGKPQYQTYIDLILKDIDITKYRKKAERKIFIAQKFTHLTKGEQNDLSIMLEMQLRNQEDADTSGNPDEESEEPVQEGQG
jgi:hypothetical protein